MLMKCRICSNLNDNLKYVFRETPEGKLIMTMFKTLTNFEWIDCTEIPSCMCNKCELSLETSYNFQKLCQESHTVLLESLTITKADIDDSSDDSNCGLSNDMEQKINDGNEMHESVSQDFSNVETNAAVTVKKKDVSRVPLHTSIEVRRAIAEYRTRLQKNVKCVECNFVSNDIRGLAIHMGLTHKFISWCCVCNKTHVDKAQHRLNHKIEREQCQLCGKRILKKYFLDHLRRHSRGLIIPLNTNNSKDENNKTKVCNDAQTIILKEQSSPVVPGPEQNTPKSINAELHICNVCTREFRTRRRLQVHIKQDHNNQNLHKCSHCDKSFKSRSTLIQHERTHTGEKPYICNICGKGFAQSNSKNIHMKRHTGRPEKCDICEKRFCRPAELKLHMRRHTGEKPFLCPICGKTFIQKSHLMDHANRHNERSQYKCHLCEKSFKNKSTLTDHLRQHSGFKRFKCDQCEYSCYKGYVLKQHMKRHNNDTKIAEKMYICLVCQKGFASQALLKSHSTLTHDAIL